MIVDLEAFKVVQADEILAKIIDGVTIEYNNVIIEGDLDINKIHSNYGDNNIILVSKIKIENSKIKGLVNFKNCIFQMPVTFEKVIFLSSVSFFNAQFNNDVSFSHSQFDGDIDLSLANILGFIQFNQTYFCKYADFSDVIFEGPASFNQSIFWNDASFPRSKLKKIAYFREAKFNSAADFTNVEFDDIANFKNAEFKMAISFIMVQFAKDATFDNSCFNLSADFDNSKFLNNAYFNNVYFYGQVSFRAARFSEEADFSDAYFGSSLDLTKFRFIHLNVDWDSIKDIALICDGGIYLDLIKNFKYSEKYKDADDCYYVYRRRGFMNKDNSIRQEIYDLISLISCGYGTRLSYILLWMSGSIAGFGVLYFYILTQINTSIIEGIKLNNSAPIINIFFECMYISTLIFTGGSQQISQSGGYIKFLIVIESIIGYIFMAFFVVVLARKLIR